MKTHSQTNPFIFAQIQTPKPAHVGFWGNGLLLKYEDGTIEIVTRGDVSRGRAILKARELYSNAQSGYVETAQGLERTLAASVIGQVMTEAKRAAIKRNIATAKKRNSLARDAYESIHSASDINAFISQNKLPKTPIKHKLRHTTCYYATLPDNSKLRIVELKQGFSVQVGKGRPRKTIK